jgi:hypothetical protein
MGPLVPNLRVGGGDEIVLARMSDSLKKGSKRLARRMFAPLCRFERRRCQIRKLENRIVSSHPFFAIEIMFEKFMTILIL